MLRDKTLTIDLDKPKVQEIRVKQYDYGFPLIVTILDENNPVDLTGIDVLMFVKSKELVQANPVSIEGNVVTFNITSNMTAKKSTDGSEMSYTEIEIALYKQGMKISSFKNYFNIEKSLTAKANEAIEAQDNFSIVEKILQATEGVEDLKSVNEVLSTVQTDIDGVNTRLDTMNTTVNSLDTKLGTIDTNVNTVLGKIQAIDNILGQIEGE